MSSPIEVEGVSKKYGNHKVLDKVGFSVGTGSVFAILGENGAGKTTLIRILLGLEKPDGGRVRILGSHEHYSSQELSRQIGYVPERPSFHEWMTVYECGWFVAGFLGEEFLHRFVRLLDRYQLPRDTKVSKLSKGMRAKVSLALALAKDPKILILDEPTSGLDAIIRREVLESLVELAADGKTVFLCSHQIHEVERVADTVGFLDGAQLVLIGRLEKLKLDFVDCRIAFRPEVRTKLALPGEILREYRSGRQFRYLIRLPHNQHHQLDAIAEHNDVESLEAHAPSLEDIFVAIMNEKRKSSGGLGEFSQDVQEAMQ